MILYSVYDNHNIGTKACHSLFFQNERKMFVMAIFIQFDKRLNKYYFTKLMIWQYYEFMIKTE